MPCERQVKPLAVPTHPADLPRGHTDHERKVRHVTSDDGAGTDKGMAPDSRAADDSAVGAECRALPHERAPKLILARHRSPRVHDVGEHHARAAEHVVLQRHRVVDADVVLDAHVVADHDVVADVDVLPERAVAADARARADMDPVPDARALTDLGALVHDRGWMRGVRHVRSASGRLAQAGLAQQRVIVARLA